jgi:hypothetical protein
MSGLTVRRIPFEFPGDLAPHWNAAKPEWSHMVNGASLVMPYLEPYLIQCVRQGLPHIADPVLRAVAQDYCAQEGQHYRQHRRFNDLLIRHGYPELRAHEEAMARTYARFLERRSLRFHLAYAAGFETMALAVGHWLVDDREYLFGGADPRVASLVLWHFVEEIEHKNAALDVYNAVDGGYLYRLFGLFYASFHVMALSRRAYRTMLRRDGRWWQPRARLRLWREVLRFFGRVLPHMVRCCAPGHDPRTIADPPWATAWMAAYGAGAPGVPILDTAALAAPLTAVGSAAK